MVSYSVGAVSIRYCGFTTLCCVIVLTVHLNCTNFVKKKKVLKSSLKSLILSLINFESTVLNDSHNLTSTCLEDISWHHNDWRFRFSCREKKIGQDASWFTYLHEKPLIMTAPSCGEIISLIYYSYLFSWHRTADCGDILRKQFHFQWNDLIEVVNNYTDIKQQLFFIETTWL